MMVSNVQFSFLRADRLRKLYHQNWVLGIRHT